jgi:hypothetical protein
MEETEIIIYALLRASFSGSPILLIIAPCFICCMIMPCAAIQRLALVIAVANILNQSNYLEFFVNGVLITKIYR